MAKPIGHSGKASIVETLNRSGTAVWQPACQRTPSVLASDKLSPQGCRMGPLHPTAQIQCSKVPYRKFYMVF